VSVDISIYARAYARALYFSAVERQELDEVVSDMNALAAQWRESKELRVICKQYQPGNTHSHEQWVDTLWGKTFSGTLLVLLRSLAHRGQLELIPSILEYFHKRYDEGRRCAHVSLTFAEPPTEHMVAQMREKILKVRGGTLQMQVTVNPELIAGFVMTLNDQRIDASMAGRLNRLRLGLQKPGV
jgi:F-type H+-transporting ATPase subunit delta